MYTRQNFFTKAALKDAVNRGIEITVFNPGIGDPPPRDGVVHIEGPHYPKPHAWYAKCQVIDGKIIKVLA